YMQVMHYIGFLPIAVAHAVYVVNVWPWPSWHARHHQVAEAVETVAYLMFGGMAQTIASMTLQTATVALRVRLQFMTIGLLFFSKGFAHFCTMLTGLRFFDSMTWTHLQLIGLMLWNLNYNDHYG